MDFYTAFKLLHVLCAVAWVGGGITLLVSSMLATRAGNSAGLFAGLDVMNRLGKTWFIPASFLTVIFGAVTATLGGMWSEAWIIIGLAGFASTFFTGLLLLEPTGLKIGAMLEAGETDAALAQGRRLLTVGKFDYTVMGIVVADMVLKPMWGDWLVLGAMAAILAAGAALFLVPVFRSAPASVPAA